MSWLSPTVALESCETTLRGRRRSSVRPLAAVPLISCATSFAADDSAISDEVNIIENKECSSAVTSTYSQAATTPSLSLLSDAHVSDYFTSTAVPRHNTFAPILHSVEILSPTITLPPSGLLSRKSSLDNLRSDPQASSRLERLKWRLISGFFAYFLCGWGDGVTATVLPFFTADYHLTSMTSSLLFFASTCGYILGTVLVEPILNILGRFCLNRASHTFFPYFPRVSQLFFRRSSSSVGYSASQARFLAIAISSLLHASNFIMIGSKRGFAVTFLAYSVAAFSRAILTASLNDYFASGPSQSIGYAFGLWSFGGVVSPLICQSIVAAGVPWFHFYFGSLVLSAINTTFLIYAFRPTIREFSVDRQQTLDVTSALLAQEPPSRSSPTIEDGRTFQLTEPFRLALSMRYQWAFSIFAMLYNGSETTTQGFMVTYLLATRHANPKTVGYVTSGFWGGITIGRFAWGYLTPLLTFTQRKFVIFGCLYLLIWFVNSNVENAFSTGLIGVLHGPIFPACLTMANELLPPNVHMSSMTLVSAFASFGSALFPFVSGTVASIKGAQTFPYFTVALGATMICLWSLFPSRVPSPNYIS
ncbi:MFS general substrate transporter [Tricholoma matsutake]|nr:MFS general substrate transporter [Tricholoma matsutake 945]